MARHRSGRGLLVLLIVVAVLVGGFAAADQLVRVKAQSRLSERLTAQIGSSSAVVVRIRDWPFTLSLARDRVGTVDLSIGAATLRTAGQSLAVQQAEVRVRGVGPVDDLADATTDSLDGSVVIGWSTLSRMTGIELSFAGNDQVDADASLSVFGTTVQAKLVARLAMVNPTGQLGLVDPSAELAGVQVPSEIVTGAAGRLASRLVLPGLPAGLSYAGVDVDAQGAKLSVHGSHLRLSQLR